MILRQKIQISQGEIIMCGKIDYDNVGGIIAHSLICHGVIFLLYEMSLTVSMNANVICTGSPFSNGV